MDVTIIMYTLYPQLAIANQQSNSEKLEQILELQTHLDAQVHAWMAQNGIGYFPKSYCEFNDMTLCLRLSA